MPDILTEAWRLLEAMPTWAMFALFWLTILAEAPRYFIGAQATAMALLLRDYREFGPLPPLPKVSILLAGHNEEAVIEKCVRSLRRQTFNDFEIVCVDDGSNDATYAIMRRLMDEGLVQSACRLQLRGGKAAGLNVAAAMASGDLFVVVDCDCSFDPDAIEELLRPLAADPSISATSGNILVRNWDRSLTATLQGIEYLTSISLGRAFSGILDQVSCVSGAFGAFRRSAWENVGGMDVGGGEDLDFTIRMRMRGFRVVFARHAVCYTDVPDTPFALLRQRKRWECDAFWLRFRKHKRLFNPFARPFLGREVVHQWDFVLFTFLPAMAFPFYVAWLLATYGEYGALLLAAVAMALFWFDLAIFLCAALVTGKPVYWRLLPFLPIYGLFQTTVMRLARFHAFASEAIASTSLTDNYVPQKVRDNVYWH
jgi:cellulose synthase/poly-beta-1,6-N-acetylglucosamine synthase-like glycosyltransferase